MLALVAMLGLIEVGFLFWAKRDAQKVADDVREGYVHVTSPQRLAEQACSCYQKMAGAYTA